MKTNYSINDLKEGVPELYNNDVLDRIRILRENVINAKNPIDKFWQMELMLFTRLIAEQNLTYEKVYTDKSISYHMLAGLISDLLDEGTSVIEVGCGGSMALPYLANRGIESAGIDKSTFALKYLQRLAEFSNTKLKLINGDFFENEIPNNSYDLAYNIGVIEHFDYESQKQLIKEMIRLSRKGIFIGVPNPNSPTRKSILSDQKDLPAQLRYPEKTFPVDLEKIALEENLELIEISGFNILPSKIDPKYLDDDGKDFFQNRLPRVPYENDLNKYIKSWINVEKRVKKPDLLKFGWYNYFVFV